MTLRQFPPDDRSSLALRTRLMAHLFLGDNPLALDDLEALEGKWSVQKTNEDGQRYSQTMEIKKDKFVFKISEPAGETRLYAEGDVKDSARKAADALKK